MRKLFLLLPSVVFGIQVIDNSSVQHYVKVSLKDVNRIYCNSSEIGSVAYSKEKRIELVKSGRNLFVKFLPVQKGRKLIYEKIPREAFIECGGEVFSLIFVPGEIPSTTIVLKTNKPDVEKALRFEQDEFKDFISSIIRFAYRDIPPDGYEERRINKKYRDFQEVELSLLKAYEGVNFSVLVFEVRAKKNVYLDPAVFVPYIQKPVALSLVREKLKAGEKTRLFVVVRKDA